MKVAKILLEIGKKKKIELSLDEAHELQKILSDLLGVEKGDRTTVISPPVAVPIPCPVPVRPKRYKWWEVKPIWIGGGDYADSATITCTSINDDSIAIIGNRFFLW